MAPRSAVDVEVVIPHLRGHSAGRDAHCDYRHLAAQPWNARIFVLTTVARTRRRELLERVQAMSTSTSSVARAPQRSGGAARSHDQLVRYVGLSTADLATTDRLRSNGYRIVSRMAQRPSRVALRARRGLVRPAVVAKKAWWSGVRRLTGSIGSRVHDTPADSNSSSDVRCRRRCFAAKVTGFCLRTSSCCSNRRCRRQCRRAARRLDRRCRRRTASRARRIQRSSRQCGSRWPRHDSEKPAWITAAGAACWFSIGRDVTIRMPGRELYAHEIARRWAAAGSGEHGSRPPGRVVRERRDRRHPVHPARRHLFRFIWRPPQACSASSRSSTRCRLPERYSRSFAPLFVPASTAVTPGRASRAPGQFGCNFPAPLAAAGRLLEGPMSVRVYRRRLRSWYPRRLP